MSKQSITEKLNEPVTIEWVIKAIEDDIKDGKLDHVIKEMREDPKLKKYFQKPVSPFKVLNQITKLEE